MGFYGLDCAVFEIPPGVSIGVARAGLGALGSVPGASRESPDDDIKDLDDFYAVCEICAV